MQKKKILSFLLSLTLISSVIPTNIVFAENRKRQRTVYIHAQKDLTGTVDTSTIYRDETADIYFAVDDPNKGDYLKPENDGTEANEAVAAAAEETTHTAAAEADKLGYTGDERDNYIKRKVANAVAAARHIEPEYDMNGYTLTIYFDPEYFDYASDTASPIDYTIPDENMTDNANKGELPSDVGYYVYPPLTGSGSKEINGKTYKSAFVTVFFNGGFIPQKKDGDRWYNLAKLPLKPLRTGSTQVFFDTSGEENVSLELFAKDTSGDPDKQTFNYSAENGGYHNIIIKDKTRPAEPTATPSAGSYTKTQYVKLSAEDGCDIYWSEDGENFSIYTSPIEVGITKTITCYAKRTSDGKQSNRVSYEYKIVPEPPRVFVDNGHGKELVPNVYNKDDKFTVYVSDKDVFDVIEPGSEIYYTFSNASGENVVGGSNPETEWVKLDPIDQNIEITKKTTVRLITKKLEEFSDIAEYRFGIRPPMPTATKPSGEYDGKFDVSLNCTEKNAKIYYTLDGSDPIENGLPYDGTLTIANDTTLRAVAELDGIYSYVMSKYYTFTEVDEYGVDAFYPSGVYEGNVSVTLTANDPEKDIRYSTDGGKTWIDYDKTLLIENDTEIWAQAGKDGAWGDTYKFKYKIKPLPPQFAPESTQFTNAGEVTVYCAESLQNSTAAGRFDLYYTFDESDPRTSNTRIWADTPLDTATIAINQYTVIKAVVLKDGKVYSDVVTHSYGIVDKKPTSPLVTLAPGNYTRKIGDDKGFETQFLPVEGDAKIYYTISYDGTFKPDPVPDTAILYDKTPIEVKGHTIIKAVAIDDFGVKSDVGIFEYIVAPEVPIAPPSATFGGNELPVVPVNAVKGSTVKYDINGVANEFVCNDGKFYIDTKTGNAYSDSECTQSLGSVHGGSLASPARLNIKSTLDGVDSLENQFVYTLSSNAATVAPPYADKSTGEYEEAKADEENNLLHIKLYSLNNGDKIQYKLNNEQDWIDYDGNTVKIKNDAVLRVRSEKNGTYSTAASYVYNFVPLAPIITLASGSYNSSDNPETEIKYDDRAPSDKIENDYRIMYRIMPRANDDPGDAPYSFKREIDKTMLFKAYVKNNSTGRISKYATRYYVIESENSAGGKVSVEKPYDVSSINASDLSTGDYAKGIKLSANNRNAQIHYFYTYTMKDTPGSVTTDTMVYKNTPIMVSPLMSSITITAWLEDENGIIAGSECTHSIDFVHSSVPAGSGGSAAGGGGGGHRVIDKTRKYTKDIFGNEHPTHISYINGYPDGSVKPEGKITREEMTAILYRITNHEYEKPFIATGEVFPDVPTDIWSAHDIEYMAEKGVVTGYNDGEFKPLNNLSRAEFAALVCRFAALDEIGKNPFGDLAEDHWAYENILALAKAGLVEGDSNGNFRPENDITRAEVMTVINKLLGRNPSEKYVKTLDFKPYTDLKKDTWYYTDVLEATVTHDYYLNNAGVEIEWENCK